VSGADILERPIIRDILRFVEMPVEIHQTSILTFDFLKFEEQIKHEVYDRLTLTENHSKGKIQSIRPCTPLQSGFMYQLLRYPGSYINSMTFRIPAWSSETFIEQIMDTWINRHHILRSAFVPVDQTDSQFVMITYDDLPTPTWTNSDWGLPHSGLSSTARLHPWKKEMALHIADSLNHPPWRAILETDGNAGHIHLVIFHALFDAHSLRILVDDLASLLESGGFKSSESVSNYPH